MIIKGIRKHYEEVDVEINANDFLDRIINNIKNSLMPVESRKWDKFYINIDNRWEGWSDGHAEGYSHVYREATYEEIAVMETLTEFKNAYNKYTQGK